MNELKCPKCGEMFQVDKTGYAQMLEQVRTHEFNEERIRIEKEYAQRFEEEKEHLKEVNSSERKRLEEKYATNQKTDQLKLEAVVRELESKILAMEDAKKLEINQAVLEKEMIMQNLLGQKENERLKVESKIKELEAKLEESTRTKELELKQALAEKEMQLKEIESTNQKLELELSTQTEFSKQKLLLETQTLKDNFAQQLKVKDDEVAFYKDFKAKQSTKMIGESLERYAENEFNKIRTTAFSRAYFEKDNDARSGSKGDFIFRDFDETNLEYISIMFEMKNEADETATKHKNRDFFKELDKDRHEKNCEYAVLVSMLESEDEFYNVGIVEVHEYPKMYVIRPQFFIQIISLLRNAAMNSLEYRKELALVKEQNIDITNFEEDLNAFKTGFAKNYESASKNFSKAIEEIDKSIRRMEEVKRFLTTSENQLRLANNKIEDVSVKKLTRKNPTMKEKFESLDK